MQQHPAGLRAWHRWRTPGPLAAIGLAALALSALSSAQIHTPAAMDPRQTPLALALITAIMLSYRFPIQIGLNAKSYLNSIPLFLLAATLPPTLAAILAGLGILAAELAVCRRYRNGPTAIAAAVARWTLAVLLAGLVVARLPEAIGLFLAATTLLLVDFLSAPLLIAPFRGMRPLLVLRGLVKGGLLLEAFQYALAVPTAMAERNTSWAPLLLLPMLALIHRTFKRAKELHHATRTLLERLADAVDARDPATGSHSRRVADLTAAMLRQLEVDGPEGELITAAARLHDIGKTDLPDAILRKPGPLTPEEWALMQTHPAAGALMLRGISGFGRLAPLVAAHHEAYDGSGYPRRLRGEQIPLGSRIIAVADSYDAMISSRPYRAGLSRIQVLTRLQDGRGRQWDATVVDALLASLPQLVEVTQPAPASSSEMVSSRAG